MDQAPSSSTRCETDEHEPLLGRTSDSYEQQTYGVLINLWVGTAPFAQFGICTLAALVWTAILTQEVILFSAHPLLNSAGLLLLTQTILLLQPTRTADQKRRGILFHAAFNLLGLASLLAGLIVIEVNKFGHGGEHFVSSHAVLGLITYVLMSLQALVEITQYWVPGLYGGKENAKGVWKYHRMSGYLTLMMGLATCCASTQTTFSLNVLQIQLGAMIAASGLVVGGLASRVQLHKFGFGG